MNYYQIITKAALNGGQVLKKYFGQTLKIKQKSIYADFCTKADIESEAAILEIISKNFPNYSILSEEIGFIDKKSEFCFIIDPLDGSNNFVLGISYFSVAIALLKNNEAIFSVIHNPILNKTYYAEKDKGSFLDNNKLLVSKEKDIKKATVSYSCAYINSLDYYANNIVKALNNKNIKRILTNWSPTLDFCLLASGKIEAVINNNSEIYDHVAGKLIAREAGAIITDFKGKKEENDKNNIFLASNQIEIHQQILNTL